MIAAIVNSIIYVPNGIASAHVHTKTVAPQVSAGGQVSAFAHTRNEVEIAEAASV